MAEAKHAPNGKQYIRNFNVTDQTKDLLNAISSIFLRCWLGGFVLLFVWLGVTQLMSDFIHKLHGPMFGLSDHELDLIFYCGMGLLKFCVLTFFLIPWLAIKLVLKNQISIDAAEQRAS